MAKLNIKPTPNPKNETSDTGSGDSIESVKRKRNFEVTDADALYKQYPNFFKLVPDYGKIRAAIKIEIPLPGVTMIDESQATTNNDGEENAA